MTDLNNVDLIGRLVRDIDDKSFGYVGSGNARLNFTIAVHRSKNNGEQYVDEASFFDVTVWGKYAESLKKYLHKGDQVAVKGYLKQDRWEKDGQKFSRVGIVAEHVQRTDGSKKDSSENEAAFTPTSETHTTEPSVDDGSIPF